MAKEPTLNDLTSLTNEPAAINTINNNNDAVVAAFTNTLSRDGSTPNNMEADLDMDGNQILNVADPTLDTHLVTKGYADANYGGSLLVQIETIRDDVEAFADSANQDAISAESDAQRAEDAADRAEAAPDRLSTLSSTSAEISIGVKTFTVEADLLLTPGVFVTIVDNAAPTSNFMFGSVSVYSGTSLSVGVSVIGGSGTYADWTITLSGARGAQGPQGSPGSGAGDMLAANNLSDVDDVPTARANLGLQIGSNVQAYDVVLDSLSANSATSGALEKTGADTVGTFTVSAAGKALIDDIDAASQRTTLGLGSAAVATLIDDDSFATATASNVPSAESVKAYVDGQSGVDYQTFTANGTWNKPSGGTIALVQAWGGGGSGGRSSGGQCGGGGGGAYVEKWIPLAGLTSTVSVTVGAGGAAVSAAGNGNAGGNSTFGSYVTAYGGGAGGGVAGSANAAGGGGGGTVGAGGNANGGTAGTAGAGGGGAGGVFGANGSQASYAQGGGGGGGGQGVGGASFSGGGGGGGSSANTTLYAGGSSVQGGAGGAGTTNNTGNGVAGTAPGGGGGGAYSPSGSSGAGARGEVRVTVF